MNELTLGDVSNKVLKKDDQVNNANKYENDLVYNSVHNFNKYIVFHLSKT